MKCEDCNFEYETGAKCPRCGYDPSEDLIGYIDIASPQVNNRLEAEFNDFCRQAQGQENGEAKIRAQWKVLDGKAKAGDLDARHIFSHVALARKEYDAAHRILASLADAGHAPAMLDLARLYDEGLGIEANRFDAVKLYRLAAAKGNPLALFKLAEQHGGSGILRTDPMLANAIMEKLVAAYPNMFQRKPRCPQDGGACTNGPTAEQFAVQSAFQMARLIKYAILLGLVAFVLYAIWSEFIR